MNGSLPSQDNISGSSGLTSASKLRGIVGIIVILIGLWILASLFRLVPYTTGLPLPAWAGIFALGGILLASSSRTTLWPGLLLALVSMGYLIRYTGLIDVDGFHKVWIALILLVGLAISVKDNDKS